MRNVLTVWRREMVSCFLSPIAYVTMVIFLAMSGGTFMLGLVRNEGGPDTMFSYLFGAVFIWLTALVTVISMRIFPEEFRSGTIETLLTAPVTEAEVVLGKFAGALSFLVVAVAPLLSAVFIVQWLSPALRLQDIDMGAGIGGLIIFLIISAFFVSVGLLISLMTRNQIVAAIWIFSTLWLIMLFGWLLSGFSGPLGAVGLYVSTSDHIEEFCRGSVDLRPVVLYVSGTIFMLFCAVRVLESRRWR